MSALEGDPPVARVRWAKAHRIIRSRFPPIDLFEDIADPHDWDALARAEMKTNPRFELAIGRLDLVPPGRRVSGPGATWVMAPFTHCSMDRPSRFSDGSYGVYYAANTFEAAVAETVHHHERFMRRTAEAPGWTSEFRELVGSLDARLHDLRDESQFAAVLDPDDHRPGQALGAKLWRNGSNGVIYPSVRQPNALAIGAFFPDVVGVPQQGRHLAYHWNGEGVDQVKDMTAGVVYALHRS